MQNSLLNLTILALLLFLFVSADRIVYDRRIRFWLLGWIAVFVHLLVGLHGSSASTAFYSPLQAAVDLFLFTFTGLCFLFSFLPRMPRLGTVLLAALFALPAAILIFLSLSTSSTLWPIVLTIVAGETIAVVATRRLLSPTRGYAHVAAQIIAVLSGLLMLTISRHLPTLIPYLVLAQIFLLASLGLHNVCIARKTRGCVGGIVGLLGWGISMPLHFLVESHMLPRLATLERWNLWDFPMFLTAFGMTLILIEENVRCASARSEDYRQLFDCHPLPMYIYNIETLRFVRVNEAAIHHYGYTAEEFTRMTIEGIRPASELPRLRKVLAGERRSFNQTHGWRHQLKNGRIVDVDIYRHSLRFEGQPCNMILALDVTQRNAAEHRLLQTYKLESIGKVTSGIAHDFNNLLAILMSSLELVDRRNPAPSSRALIQQAILSVRRGAALTRRLLAFSRNDPAEPSPISVNTLVDSLTPFLKTSLGPAIALEVAFDAGTWQAAVDPNELENALLNLALNARDAMKQGGTLQIAGRNLTIEHGESLPFGELSRGDYVLLTMTDDGTGMSPDVLARATEPFFTTKQAGEGTGLGLNMVASFLRQSGGCLHIESQPGQGTAIQLYLPRADASPSLAPVIDAIAAQAIPGGNEVLLLVEDEPTIRHVLGILLRSLGYTVLDASDAVTALTHIRNAPGIALLLTDVILPRGMDGASLAEKARALQPTLQVLFSSGYTRDVLLREARIPEDAHLLTKPYQVAELARHVRQALGRPLTN